jgi:hypothetical protein
VHDVNVNLNNLNATKDILSHPIDQPLLTEDDLAFWLKVSKSALRKWRLEGRGPAFVKLGRERSQGAVVRYQPNAVRSWLADMPVGGTTA